MGAYIKEEPLGRILRFFKNCAKILKMAYPGKKYFNGYIEAIQCFNNCSHD